MQALAADVAGLEEVAAALGRSPGWLRRHWLAIHEAHGFPRKHPTGMTWPRAAVAAWLRAGGMARPSMVPANDALAARDPEEAYMAELERHYGVAP